MGHGNHWGCLDENTESVVSHFVATGISKGEISHKLELMRKMPNADIARPTLVYSIDYPNTDLATSYILFKDDPKENVKLFSAFPFANAGEPTTLIISKIDVWEYGLEAVVEAETESGAMVGFFDTRYFLNASKYEVGKKYKFILAGLAYTVENANNFSQQITDQEALKRMYAEREWEPEYDENGNLEPLKITFDNFCTLMPNDKYPDDATYFCKIKSIDSFQLDYLKIYKIKTIFHATEPPLDGILYISEKILPEGMEIKIGDNISGQLWMQGFLQNEE